MYFANGLMRTTMTHKPLTSKDYETIQTLIHGLAVSLGGTMEPPVKEGLTGLMAFLADPHMTEAPPRSDTARSTAVPKAHILH